MEDRILFLLSQISMKASDLSIYQELSELIKNPEIIVLLINFIARQELDYNIRFISLIMLNNAISQCFNSISQDSYIQLKQISEILKEHLLFIFYSQSPTCNLIPHLIFLFHSISRLLELFYASAKIPDLPSPEIFVDITPIVVEIIQNESIRRNAFNIAIEFLVDASQYHKKSPIRMDFCKYIHPFLSIPDYLCDSIKILTLMNDFSMIPTLLENVEQIQNSDGIIQFIRYLQAFSDSVFDVSLDKLALFLSLFNSIVILLVQFIQMNNEYEIIILESIIFFSKLFENIMKCIGVTPELNTLCSTILQFIFPNLPVLLFSLFSKVGIDETLEFFGISRESIRVLKLISNFFPKELFTCLFEQITSLLSSFPNPTISPILILSSIRSYSHILFSICTNSEGVDKFSYLQFAFDNSVKLIQTPQYCVDSATLLKKALKTLSYLQSESKDLNESFDLDSIANHAFLVILQAYSAYDYEIQKQLVPILSSILDYVDIHIECFIEHLVQFVFQSKSINDYFLSSQLLIYFIVKSMIIDPNNEQLTQLITNLIQFVLKEMLGGSVAFSISIGILDVLIQKFPQFTHSILSVVWPKLTEILDSVLQDENSLNNENIGIYPIIIHFLSMTNIASIEIGLDINEINGFLIDKIPHCFNPVFPLEVRVASWSFLNTLLTISFNKIPPEISSDENKTAEYFATKLELLFVFSKIVNSALFLEFNCSKSYNDDENVLKKFLDVIASIIFTFDITSRRLVEHVNNPLFIQKIGKRIDPSDCFFFSDEDPLVAVVVLSNIFRAIRREIEYDLPEIAVCAISSLCLIPDASKKIKTIIDEEFMQQIVNQFVKIRDESKKQIVSLGIQLLFKDFA